MIEKFCTYLYSIKNRSHRTITEYRYDLKNFEKFIKKDLITVNSGDIILYLKNLSDKNMSSSCRARKLSSIKSFYRYLQMFDVITASPAINIGTPKIEKRLPKYLTLVESIKLIETSKKQKDNFYKYRDTCMLQMFLNCGLRLSELVDLHTAKISGDKIEIIGKGNKQRFVYMNSACQKALSDWLNYRKNFSCGYLFVSKKDIKISNTAVQAKVKTLFEKAGLDSRKYHVHSLRHTSATLMYQYGKTDVRVLQQFLGHSTIESTMIYTHVNDNQLRSAVINNPLANL
jgi:site-specific recombinase XerD